MPLSSIGSVQGAVYRHLTADSNWNGLGVSLHQDSAPEGQAYPYAVIYSPTSVPWDTQSTYGMEHTVQIHLYINAENSLDGNVYVGTLYSSLHDADIDITGFNTVISKFEFHNTFKDPNEPIIHHVFRLRVVCDEV